MSEPTPFTPSILYQVLMEVARWKRIGRNPNSLPRVGLDNTGPRFEECEIFTGDCIRIRFTTFEGHLGQIIGFVTTDDQGVYRIVSLGEINPSPVGYFKKSPGRTGVLASEFFEGGLSAKVILDSIDLLSGCDVSMIADFLGDEVVVQNHTEESDKST